MQRRVKLQHKRHGIERSSKKGSHYSLPTPLTQALNLLLPVPIRTTNEHQTVETLPSMYCDEKFKTVVMCLIKENGLNLFFNFGIICYLFISGHGYL